VVRFPPLVLSLLLTVSAAAEKTSDPKIDGLSAVAAGGKVSVRFSLVNALGNGEFVEALESGLPTSVTYLIEIYRDHPNWFDDGIAEARVEIICTFNSLTREYLVNYRRDRKLVRSETLTDLASLESRLANIDEPDLFEIGDRKPWKLKVRVKADLMRGWLFYVVPWQLSTGWSDARVRVAEASPP
jgi:hypothetical protein